MAGNQPDQDNVEEARKKLYGLAEVEYEPERKEEAGPAPLPGKEQPKGPDPDFRNALLDVAEKVLTENAPNESGELRPGLWAQIEMYLEKNAPDAAGKFGRALRIALMKYFDQQQTRLPSDTQRKICDEIQKQAEQLI